MATATLAKPQIGKIDVQGHRGARTVLPENTLAGFDYALNIGADTLELDLGVSRDNVVVVVHDQRINTDICQYKDGSAILSNPWIHELSFAQIKQFDCGSKPNLRFANQTPQPGSEIPSLAEVFEMITHSTLAAAKTIRFNIETKSNPAFANAQPSPDKFVSLVLEQVDRFELRSRVTLQSFDARTLVAAHAQAPDVQRAIILSKKPDDWLATASASHASMVLPHFQQITADDVRIMQNAGLKVVVWTPNAEHQWRRLMRYGVDGIITDDPLRLLELLERVKAPGQS
jgi:glycerophosphoryl diester phosphodiesterase